MSANAVQMYDTLLEVFYIYVIKYNIYLMSWIIALLVPCEAAAVFHASCASDLIPRYC